MIENIPSRWELGEIVKKENLIEIKRKGEEKSVGQLHYSIGRKPVDYFSIDAMFVDTDRQGKGFASQMMAEMEKMSQESGMPIVLFNSISGHMPGQNPGSVGMYSRRQGWVEMAPGNHRLDGYYIYGVQDETMLERFSKEYQDM